MKLKAIFELQFQISWQNFCKWVKVIFETHYIFPEVVLNLIFLKYVAWTPLKNNAFYNLAITVSSSLTSRIHKQVQHGEKFSQSISQEKRPSKQDVLLDYRSPSKVGEVSHDSTFLFSFRTLESVFLATFPVNVTINLFTKCWVSFC